MNRPMAWIAVLLAVGAMGIGAWLLFSDSRQVSSTDPLPAGDRDASLSPTPLTALPGAVDDPLDSNIGASEAIDDSVSADPATSEAALGPGRINGAVFGTDGEPIPEARLLVRHRDRGVAVVSSGPSGRFELAGLPVRPEKLMLRVTAKAHVPMDFEFALPRRTPEIRDVVLVLYGGRELGGRVVDRDGRTVAGSKVWFEWARKGQELRNAFRPIVETDADGRFEFPGAPREELRVWTWKPGIALTSTEELPTDVTEVELVADREAAAFVEVEILEADGDAPISNAKIMLEPKGSQHWGHARTLVGRTNARGHLRLGPLPAVEHTWSVEAEGRALQRVSDEGAALTSEPLAIEAGQTAWLRFRALPTARVSGRLETPSGAGIGGVRVTAKVPKRSGEFEAVCDRDGGFVLALPTAPVTHKATFQLRAGTHDLLPQFHRILELGAESLVLVASTRATVSGEVYSVSGEPIVGAEVRAQPVDGDWRWLAEVSDVRTDRSGAFTLSVPTVSENGIRLIARRPPLGSAESVILQPQSGDRLSGVVLTLQSAPEVFGRVVREDGTPVPGAVVRARQTGRAVSSSVACDLQGSFRMAGLDAGELALEALYREVWNRASQELVLSDRGQPVGPIDIVVREPWVLEGLVVSTEGEPIPGAEVIVRSDPKGGRALAKGASDGDGRFRLSLQADQRVHLDVGVRPELGARVQGQDPEPARRWVEPGDTLAPFVIALPGIGGVRGRLILPEGPGPGSIRLRLTTQQGGRVSQLSLKLNNRAFELPRVWAGSYEMELLSSTFEPFRMPLTIEPDLVVDLGDLRVELGELTRFVVTDSQGNAIPAATLIVGKREKHSTDADGQVELVLARGGERRIELHKKGFARVWGELPAEAVGKESRLVLPRAGTIRCRNDDSSRGWTAQVDWQGTTEGIDQAYLTGFNHRESGDCVFRDLPPGPYRVRIVTSVDTPGEPEERLVELTEGQELLVDFSR